MPFSRWPARALGLGCMLLGLYGPPGRAADPGILIPLYSYPTWYVSTNYLWHDVAQAAGEVPVLAIIDPADGPGPGFPNTDYAHGLGDLHAAGIGILGYVDTAFGTRDPVAVQADIDAYTADARVTGIFLDQGLANAANFTYYSTICHHIRSHPALTNIVLNSGPAITEDYLGPGYVDIAMIFEQSVGWPDYTPEPYFAGYPPGRFSMLVHTCPDAGAMETNVALAVHRNVGWVYVTDDAMPNPWNAPALYWTQLVETVASYRGVASTDLQAASNGLVASFATVPRQPCRVQVGNASGWTDLTPLLQATGRVLSVADTNPLPAAQSYRLRLLPP